jgi:hypothetical protein
VAVVVYLKQVKPHGANGFAVRDRSHCPIDQVVCVTGDGETYCIYAQEWVIMKKLSDKLFLMTCTAPKE